MEKKDMQKKIFAGLFFFAGIALISLVILVIGVEKGLTQPKFQMTVLFDEVGGLTVGAPVSVSGVHVGIVSSIDFLEEDIQDRSVIVKLNIFQKYEKQLRKSDRFLIQTEGILGGKFVEISTDKDIHRADLSQPIIGEDPLNVQDLAEVFGDAAVALSESSGMINNIVNEMERISTTSKRLLNRIEQRVIEGNLFKVF